MVFHPKKFISDALRISWLYVNNQLQIYKRFCPTFSFKTTVYEHSKEFNELRWMQSCWVFNNFCLSIRYAVNLLPDQKLDEKSLMYNETVENSLWRQVVCFLWYVIKCWASLYYENVWKSISLLYVCAWMLLNHKPAIWSKNCGFDSSSWLMYWFL